MVGWIETKVDIPVDQLQQRRKRFRKRRESRKRVSDRIADGEGLEDEPVCLCTLFIT